MKKIILFSILGLLIIALGYSIFKIKKESSVLNEQISTTYNQDSLLSDVYPLYPNLKWGKEVPTTNTIFSDAKAVGYEIKSESISDTEYLRFKESFEEHYDKKLIANGWVRNNKWAAGGPSGSITGYSKDNKIIIISYSSKEITVNKDLPFACPCNINLSIFFGTLD